MNIYPLLSTRERERILGYILEHPSEEINMNRLARMLGLSAGQLHKYVTILRKTGLVSGNRLQEIPFTAALRLLWNLKRMEDAGLMGILHRHFPSSKGIGIFGSWSKGVNLEDSDLDIWIKIANEPGDLDIAKAVKALGQKMAVPVDIIIATPQRLRNFREKSDTLYFSLYGGITLWGEGL